MKKWNTPEVEELKISETAKPEWSYYNKDGSCSLDGQICPVDNNGYGKCNKCGKLLNSGS